jgi:hypothetical protein
LKRSKNCVAVAFAGWLWTSLQPALATTDATGQSHDVASAEFNLPGCRNFLAAGGSPQRLWSAWMCVGKVLTLDAYSMFLAPPLRACAVKLASTENLVRALVAHLDANPTRWQDSFSVLTLEALAEAWPCPPSVPVNLTRSPELSCRRSPESSQTALN